jgi:hypothetical protein
MALDISTRSARQDPKASPIAAASGVPKKPAESKLNRRKTTRREEKKKRRKEEKKFLNEVILATIRTQHPHCAGGCYHDLHIQP